MPFLDILFFYFITISQSRFPAGRIPGFSAVDTRPVSLFIWVNIRNQYAVSFAVFPQLVEGLFQLFIKIHRSGIIVFRFANFQSDDAL